MTANPPPLDPEVARAAGQELQALAAAAGTVVLGQNALLENLIVALIAGGHALLEGVPGTAKTLTVQTFAELLSADFGRVQFTPDLMPTDVTGVGVLNASGTEFEFRRGPIFCDLLLADEINRAPAKTQAALLEAMQERRVTVDGVSHALAPAFTVIATQNSVEFEGTYPLPEAQLDRFLVKLEVDYPSEEAEVALLERIARGFDSAAPETFGLPQRLPAGRLLELRALAARVHVEPEVVRYCAALVRATRNDPALTLGAGPRASVALFLAARARALFEGRDFCTPDDVKTLAPAVLAHRVLLGPEAQIDGGSSAERVASALRSVPAPETSTRSGAPTP